MGMFDTIYCYYPLPGDVKPTKPDFQTKDLECFLEVYKISKEGFLTKNGLPYYLYGELNFYTSENGEWFEYKALFSDGKLIYIREVNEQTR